MATFTPKRQVNDLFFIHGAFGSFFAGVLDWFADDFYDRFNYKVIGTYDKAVQFFNDKKKQGIDPNGKHLPSISLDPMLDFSPADVGGKQLWQYQHMAPGLGMRMYPNGINLKEQDYYINIVYTRYQGTFETVFWLSSIYELLDFRTYLLQYTGGFNRWIRPKHFWTSLILPDEFSSFETKDGGKIDWSNTPVDLIHVNTINKHKLAYPISLSPMWRLDSFADSSTKYGGDQIADYKLSATFTYEINIPTYTVTSTGLDPKISLSFSLGTINTKYPLSSPYKILKSIVDIKPDMVDSGNKIDFMLYSISDLDEEKSHRYIEFSETTVKYPNKFTTWNYIVSGKLVSVSINDLESATKNVTKSTIIVIDSYNQSLLPYIRRCAGVICKKDTQTDVLYSKCELLKKPLITNITTDEMDKVLSYLNKSITIDTLRGIMYDSVLESVVTDPSDPVIGLDIVENIKTSDPDLYTEAVNNIKNTDATQILPEIKGGSADISKMKKRLVKDNCDGITRIFYLGYIIDDDSIGGLLIYIDDDLMIQGLDYTVTNNDTINFTVAPVSGSNVYIGGEFLTIKDSKLFAVYEYTEPDLTSDDDIIITYTSKIASSDDIVLVSYIGRLEQDRDYIVDLDAQTITITLDPKVGEIVQVFLYI